MFVVEHILQWGVLNVNKMDPKKPVNIKELFLNVNKFVNIKELELDFVNIKEFEG